MAATGDDAASALAVALGLPAHGWAIGRGLGAWVIYVTDRALTKRVRQAVAGIGAVHNGEPVRVVVTGAVRPARAHTSAVIAALPSDDAADDAVDAHLAARRAPSVKRPLRGAA